MAEVFKTNVWGASGEGADAVPAIIQAGTPVSKADLSKDDLDALRESGAVCEQEEYDAREEQLSSTVGASWNALERQRRMIEAGENEDIDLDDRGDVQLVNPNSHNLDDLQRMADDEGVDYEEGATKAEIADAINEARQA